MVEEKLRSLGFRVSIKNIVHRRINGDSINEKRISGYSPDGNIKVIYSEYSTGYKKLSILLNGSLATSERGELARRLGGKMDLDENERLYIIFTVNNEKVAEEIIDELLGTPSA